MAPTYTVDHTPHTLTAISNMGLSTGDLNDVYALRPGESVTTSEGRTVTRLEPETLLLDAALARRLTLASYGSKGGKARAKKLSPERRIEIARMGGLKGGKARAKKLSPKRRREIARMGGFAAARNASNK